MAKKKFNITIPTEFVVEADSQEEAEETAYTFLAENRTFVTVVATEIPPITGPMVPGEFTLDHGIRLDNPDKKHSRKELWPEYNLSGKIYLGIEEDNIAEYGSTEYGWESGFQFYCGPQTKDGYLSDYYSIDIFIAELFKTHNIAIDVGISESHHALKYDPNLTFAQQWERVKKIFEPYTPFIEDADLTEE